jgi:hypothetical protein
MPYFRLPLLTVLLGGSMLRRCLAPATLAAGLLLAACEGDVSEPLADRADVVALLDGRGAAGSYPAHSLPGLLQAAIRTVYTEHGAGAARALVDDLRRAREQTRLARAGGNGEVAAWGAAARAEELEIVMKVFGDGVAQTTLLAVRGEASRLAAEAARAPAAARQRTGELLAELGRHLDAAEAASRSGAARVALDHAVQAGALADRAHYLLEDARRIAALPELFEGAVARLRSQDGGDAARSRLAEYNALQRRAEDVVRSGDHQRAHAALKAARDEQIRVVLEVAGAEPVGRLLQDATAALDELDVALAASRSAGRDVTRLGRMAGSARDMLGRSTAALAEGDAATALDLGSHAAGLINTLRANLAR